MIELLFKFATDYIFIRVDGNNVLFSNTAFGARMAPIDGLKLSQEGAVKEFPDLKDDVLWKEKAIQRFKDKIKAMQTENEVVNYLIDDLRPYGYKGLFKQRQGFRREKIGDIS